MRKMFVKKRYSQRDWRWRWRRLGTCRTTFGKSGCIITCLAMIRKKTPIWINTYLRDRGGYARGCLVRWNKLGVIGLKFDKMVTKRPKRACIAKVWTKKRTAHFIVLYKNNKMVDPWTGKRTKLKYRLAGKYYLVR